MAKAKAKAKAMDFSAALRRLKSGARIRRAGWNGKDMYLDIEMGRGVEEHRFPSLPVTDFIVLRTPQGNLIPWVASQSDLLGEDWEVVEVEAQYNRDVEAMHALRVSHPLLREPAIR